MNVSSIYFLALLRKGIIFTKVGNSTINKMHGKSLSKELFSTSPKAVALNNIVPSLCLTGAACLRKAKLTASISGLDLDFEMKHLNATYIKNRKNTHREEKDSAGAFNLYYVW